MGFRSFSCPVICFQDIFNGVNGLHLMLLHHPLEKQGDFCKFDRPVQEGVHRHFIGRIEDGGRGLTPFDGLIGQLEAEKSLWIGSGKGEGFAFWKVQGR